jgi:hypothetical protein
MDSTSVFIYEPSANNRNSSNRSKSTLLTDTSGTLFNTAIPKDIGKEQELASTLESLLQR